MSGLKDLLERMREHPSFPELLKVIQEPGVKLYRPSQGERFEEQQAEWIFRSGAQKQDVIWRDLLTTYVPPQGKQE
jgi:hypothetical protein